MYSCCGRETACLLACLLLASHEQIESEPGDLTPSEEGFLLKTCSLRYVKGDLFGMVGERLAAPLVRRLARARGRSDGTVYFQKFVLGVRR